MGLNQRADFVSTRPKADMDHAFIISVRLNYFYIKYRSNVMLHVIVKVYTMFDRTTINVRDSQNCYNYCFIFLEIQIPKTSNSRRKHSELCRTNYYYCFVRPPLPNTATMRLKYQNPRTSLK